jgi:N6-L-threonylcarbamoyladenine synthase
MTGGLTLGIETSCDETSAAILRGDGELLSHIIHSQDVHRLYGGVVPEIASREHLRTLDAVVARALEDAEIELGAIDLFAVTAGPGLIGALLVGVAWAKAAAWALGRPVVGVHHMEGHLFAVALEEPAAEPPFIALLVSGGHTLLLRVPRWGEYHLLGETRDDAVGEAFDKAAKLLGLPYPGGPSIERAAAGGDPSRHPLPRPLLSGRSVVGDPDHYDFSYSGLKTALRTRIRQLEERGAIAAEVDHLAASFQEAALEVLVEKTRRALLEHDYDRVLLGGGVANSRRLRSLLIERLPRARILYPSPRLATDNAAMIARAGMFRYRQGEVGGLDLNARADLPFPGLVRNSQATRGSRAAGRR